MRFTPRVYFGFVVGLACVFGAASHPSAQAPAAKPVAKPAAPAPAAPGQAAEAPLVRFDAAGISVEEAVRVTLANDPNIRRRETDVMFQEGIAREQGGPFDTSWLTSLSYSHRISELTESRKQSERDKRTKLDEQISTNQVGATSAANLIPLIDRLKSAAPGQEPIAEIRAIDPAMADLLTLFDSLIANTTDATIRQNLINTRTDFINTTIGRDFENSLKDQVTTFNDTKVARANLGEAPSDESFQNTAVQFQLSKMFRSGIQFAPFLDGNRDGTNFRGKPEEAEFGGKGLKDLYTFHAGVGVNFPLMRNRGATAIAAQERAAYIERDASQLAARHEGSAATLRTVLAYWDVRNAMESVEIMKRSSDLQANLLRLTQQLIDAGELPRAELARAQASDARIKAQLEEGNRQLHQAQVALANAMGVSASGDAATLPLARDTFPPVPDPAALQTTALVGAAPAQRLDLSAAVKSQEAGQVLLAGAETQVRPRLDLNTSTWWTALEENSVRRAIDRWVGPSTQLSLTLEKPFGNNFYRGQLAAQEADLKSRQITANDLQRQIRLGVLQAASTLPDAIAGAKQAEAAVGFYRNIYDADVERYRTGDATLLDTVITEQQQTEAMLALVAARSQVAHLIAQLRFQTGTILGPNNTIAPQNLQTVPTR